MSTGKKINVDKLSMEVSEIFNHFQDVTYQQVAAAVENTAKISAKKINQNAAALFGGKKYKRSWKYQRDPDLKGRWKHSMVLYSTRYQVAHLLENGHAKRGGGRVAGKPHIAPVEQQVRDVLIDEIYQAME